jgi:hypothetical protein
MSTARDEQLGDLVGAILGDVLAGASVEAFEVCDARECIDHVGLGDCYQLPSDRFPIIRGLEFWLDRPHEEISALIDMPPAIGDQCGFGLIDRARQLAIDQANDRTPWLCGRLRLRLLWLRLWLLLLWPLLLLRASNLLLRRLRSWLCASGLGAGIDRCLDRLRAIIVDQAAGFG